jgi:putative inorganic carbon (hco3(-)) transporter
MILFFLLISVMPLTRHPLWGQFVGELTIIKYLGGGCLVYALYHLITSGTFPSLLRTWQARFFLLFYFIALISYLTLSFNHTFALSPLMTYSSFLLLYVITLSVIDSPKRLRWVLLATVGAVAVASLYVIREWQKYRSVFAGFRPGWVVGDPNYFTVSALFALPIAYYVMTERKGGWERWFCAGCFLLIALAVTVAASRGGFLGLVVAFVLIAIRSRKRTRNVLGAAGLCLALALIAPSSPLDRLLHPSKSDKESTNIRSELWSIGWKMIQQHPITGIGLGNFKPMVEDYADDDFRFRMVAHNSYIEIAAELGIPGLCVFLGMMLSTLHSLARAKRVAVAQRAPLLRYSALALQTGFIAAYTAICFVSGHYQKIFWLMIFVSMCVHSLSDHLSERPLQRSPDPAHRKSADGSEPEGARELRETSVEARLG